jgi:ERCC4-type nuclease
VTSEDQPTKFLIAPSEPRIIKTIGKVSSIPEKMGSDILWHDPSAGGWVGVQRKEFKDLLASVADGRLAREVQQIQRCKIAFLIVEGKPRWSPDGACMIRYYTQWTRAQYRSLLRSVQGREIFVEHSDSMKDTVALVGEMSRWVGKGDHASLDRRPKPKGDTWGRMTDKAWACHLLQSVDGIGPKAAAAIYDYFGGALPIALTTDVKTLEKVPGVGPGTAKKILRAFTGKEATE